MDIHIEDTKFKKLVKGKTGKAYDITGLTAEILDVIADIAIGYAQKGGNALKDFLKDFRNDFPELSKITDQELTDIYNKANMPKSEETKEEKEEGKHNSKPDIENGNAQKAPPLTKQQLRARGEIVLRMARLKQATKEKQEPKFFKKLRIVKNQISQMIKKMRKYFLIAFGVIVFALIATNPGYKEFYDYTGAKEGAKRHYYLLWSVYELNYTKHRSGDRLRSYESYSVKEKYVAIFKNFYEMD